MFRRRRRQPEGPLAEIDLSQLESRWRTAVEETLESRGRLQSLVAQRPAGPLQERLASLAARIDAGVVAAWKIAARAQATSQALAAMDLDQVRDQLKRDRRRAANAREDDSDAAVLQQRLEALEAQHAALNQLSNSIDDAAERLRLLDLRLDTAVARAAQLVLRPDGLDELVGVDQELAAVVDELEALRQGFDAVGLVDQ